MSIEESPESNINQQVQRTGTFITRSKSFKKLVKWAFDVCDADHSGAIGKPELYTGLLLVHINCAKYAGPAACYPPTRERVEQLFDACDDDCSGEIDEDEFFQIMVILFSQVTSRILVYYAILILLVPYLTMWILDLLGIFHIGDFVMWLVQESNIINTTKDGDVPTTTTFQYLMDLIPDDWFMTMMEQTISLLLFFLVIPALFNKIDQIGYQAAQLNHTRQLTRLIELRNNLSIHNTGSRGRSTTNNDAALSLSDIPMENDVDYDNKNNNEEDDDDDFDIEASERQSLTRSSSFSSVGGRIDPSSNEQATSNMKVIRSRRPRMTRL